MLRQETLKLDTINEFLPLLQKADFGVSIEEKFRVVMAIGLFSDKLVTLARAAELSGKSLSVFIEILNRKGIPWMEYTEESLEQDNIAISKYVELIGEEK